MDAVSSASQKFPNPYPVEFGDARPIVVGIRKAAFLMSCSVSQVYELLSKGLPSYLLNGKRVIRVMDIEALFKVPTPVQPWHTTGERKGKQRGAKVSVAAQYKVCGLGATS